MIEVNIYGRGGQGAMTSSQVLASALFLDGKYAQAWPIPGIERGGAPVTAYLRFDDKEIRERDQIYNPDYSIVLDSSLINIMNINKGELIVNSKRRIENAKCVDASSIAYQLLGKHFVNIIMLGAFAAFTNLVSLNSLLKAIEIVFEEKKPEFIKKNQEGVRRIYGQIKGK